MQIVVLGAHRSGTSLITRIIAMMGAYWGPESESIGQGNENPKGFWERADVIALNDKLLASQGASWDSSALWNPVTVPAEAKEAFDAQAKAIIADMDAHAPWVMKEPRLCLTWEMWKPYVKKPVYVMVHRNPLEIARSLQKRNNMPIIQGIALWEHYLVSAFNAIGGASVIHVQYDEFLADPVKGTAAIFAALQQHEASALVLPPDEAVLEFTDLSLRRSVMDEVPLEEILNIQQLELWAICKGEKPLPGQLKLSAGARSILEANLQQYEKMLRSLRNDLHLTPKAQGDVRLEEIKARIASMHDEIYMAGTQLNKLHEEKHQLQCAVKELAEQLDQIKSSKRWKIAGWIAHIARCMRGKAIVT